MCTTAPGRGWSLTASLPSRCTPILRTSIHIVNVKEDSHAHHKGRRCVCGSSWMTFIKYHIDNITKKNNLLCFQSSNVAILHNQPDWHSTRSAIVIEVPSESRVWLAVGAWFCYKKTCKSISCLAGVEVMYWPLIWSFECLVADYVEQWDKALTTIAAAERRKWKGKVMVHRGALHRSFSDVTPLEGSSGGQLRRFAESRVVCSLQGVDLWKKKTVILLNNSCQWAFSECHYLILCWPLHSNFGGARGAPHLLQTMMHGAHPAFQSEFVLWTSEGCRWACCAS